MTWLNDAACRGLNPDWWHPPEGEPWHIHKGIKICNTCPVRQQCLNYALSFTLTEDQYGIFGGYTHKQRAQIRLGHQPKPINSRKQTITGLDDT